MRINQILTDEAEEARNVLPVPEQGKIDLPQLLDQVRERAEYLVKQQDRIMDPEKTLFPRITADSEIVGTVQIEVQTEIRAWLVALINKRLGIRTLRLNSTNEVELNKPTESGGTHHLHKHVIYLSGAVERPGLSSPDAWEHVRRCASCLNTYTNARLPFDIDAANEQYWGDDEEDE